MCVIVYTAGSWLALPSVVASFSRSRSEEMPRANCWRGHSTHSFCTAVSSPPPLSACSPTYAYTRRRRQVLTRACTHTHTHTHTHTDGAGLNSMATNTKSRATAADCLVLRQAAARSLLSHSRRPRRAAAPRTSARRSGSAARCRRTPGPCGRPRRSRSGLCVVFGQKVGSCEGSEATKGRRAVNFTHTDPAAYAATYIHIYACVCVYMCTAHSCTSARCPP